MANIKKKIENLKPGKEYLLTVRAKNADLNVTSDYVESIRFTVPQDQTTPGSISNLELYSGVEAVMFVFSFSDDKDISRYEYELYEPSQTEVVDGIRQPIEDALITNTGFNDANVFSVTIDNLQVEVEEDPSTSGLKKFWGRVRGIDTSGNAGPWTGLTPTNDHIPLIDNQFIGSLTASKITAGIIGAHEIILTQSGTPTDYEPPAGQAVLRSSNFESGLDGWLIRGDGHAEFADASIRGQVNASDFNLLDNDGNIVASLGPVYFKDWDLDFGNTNLTYNHGLAFNHLDTGNEATPSLIPRFENSGIGWTTLDNLAQSITFIGPGPISTESSSPDFLYLYPPFMQFSAFNDVDFQGYDFFNSYGSLTSGTIGSGESTYSKPSINFSTNGYYDPGSNALGIGSSVDLKARTDFDGDVYDSYIYMDSDTVSPNIIISSSIDPAIGPPVSTSVELTEESLAITKDATVSIKVWPFSQVTIGPGAGDQPWSYGTRGNAGFGQSTLVVSESDNQSNAHLSLRHTNLGTGHLDGLDLALTRISGQAYIIQRRNASLNFRVNDTTQVMTMFANGTSAIYYGGVKVLFTGPDASKSDTSTFLYSEAVYARTTTNGTNVNVDSVGRIRRSTSSKRYKENIETWSSSLSDVLSLRPVSFTGKFDDPETKILGLIAEEVEEINPKAVIHGPDGQVENINYNAIIDMLINGIKELAYEIEIIKQKI